MQASEQNQQPTLKPKVSEFAVNARAAEPVARMLGDDPYRLAKQKLAEETREQRIHMALAAAARNKREALFRLKDDLERVARAPDLSAAERRDTLFQLWDECLEPSADAGAGTDHGAMARTTILAFTRRLYPPGSPDAFTPTELAMLNRRRTSRQIFDPYGSPTSRSEDAARQTSIKQTRP